MHFHNARTRQRKIFVDSFSHKLFFIPCNSFSTIFHLQLNFLSFITTRVKYTMFCIPFVRCIFAIFQTTITSGYTNVHKIKGLFSTSNSSCLSCKNIIFGPWKASALDQNIQRAFSWSSAILFAVFLLQITCYWDKTRSVWSLLLFWFI